MSIQVMLATEADMEALRFPYLASPKMDGIRAYVLGGVVYSRANKPIPNPLVQELFGAKALERCDGELIVGDPTAADAFSATTSAVMSTRPFTRRLSFFVFDTIPRLGVDALRPFVERLYLAGRACTAYGNGRIMAARPVRHVRVNSIGALRQYEAGMLEHGYEGIMLRDPDGFYKNGRSTAREHGLLKVKQFSDGEAVIHGYEELQHNANARGPDGKRTSHKDGKVPRDMLGALVVRDTKTGVDFKIGTGFTDTVRHLLWGRRHSLEGKIVKYRYQSAGMKDAPRFPRFVGFRDKKDM